MSKHPHGSIAPSLRENIRKLLEGHGATDVTELYDALGLEKDGFDKRILGQTLRHMGEDGLVKRDGSQVWWIGKVPPNGVRGYQDDAEAPRHIRNRTVDAPPSIREPRKIVLPEYQAQREGNLVTVETAPDEYPDVVQLQVKMGDNWFSIPMTGNMRICMGDRIPKWTPDQEINTGIRAIRFVRADGSFETLDVNPSNPVVFAPA